MNTEWKIIPLIDQSLTKQANCSLIKRDHFYISESGKEEKELFHEVIKNQNCISPRQKRIFDNGLAVQERMMKYLKDIGMVKAQEIKINTSLFKGRVDAILFKDGRVAVLEVKSMNKKRFNKLHPRYCDWKAYHQIQLYMHFLKINDGIVLIECKDDQRLKEYHVKRKPQVAKEIIDRFTAMRNSFILFGKMQPGAEAS